MPALTVNEIKNNCEQIPEQFVETGTQEGETVDQIKGNFEKIFTIEIDPRLASLAKQKFSNVNHIQVINGDSAETMPSVCKQLDKPTLFWLDGHQSGFGTGKGQKDCPILEECQAIAENCKVKSIVIIDDIRLFGKIADEDYSDVTVSKIQTIFKHRSLKMSYFDSSKASNDRLVIHLQPLMETLYTDYVNYVQTICDRNEPFKSNPIYRQMLEHVWPELGSKQLQRLRIEYSMSDDTILSFCRLLDSFGSPILSMVGNLKEPISPSGLRQLYQASKILEHAKGIQSFVEVGCGQGGLFLAMKYLNKDIESYHMVDLPETLHLQKLVTNDDRVKFHSSFTFGRDVPMGCFFISNFCQSGIDKKQRNKYKEILLPKCVKGFLAWNGENPSWDSIGKPFVTDISDFTTYVKF